MPLPSPVSPRSHCAYCGHAADEMSAKGDDQSSSRHTDRHEHHRRKRRPRSVSSSAQQSSPSQNAPVGREKSKKRRREGRGRNDAGRTDDDDDRTHRRDRMRHRSSDKHRHHDRHDRRHRHHHRRHRKHRPDEDDDHDSRRAKSTPQSNSPLNTPVLSEAKPADLVYSAALAATGPQRPPKAPDLSPPDFERKDEYEGRTVASGGISLAMRPKTPAEAAAEAKEAQRVRLVFDADSGRMRHVRGTGEIVEAIVSKERQDILRTTSTHWVPGALPTPSPRQYTGKDAFPSQHPWFGYK